MAAGSAWAVDGQVLINQATVTAAGGFPYNITQPGSYKLSGNLTVTNNSNGIQVNSDNVTLDLNGFTILGPVICSNPGSPVLPVTVCTGGIGQASAGYGVIANLNFNVTVMNGTVRGFSNGVNLGYGSTIQNLHIDSNASLGIYLSNGSVTGNTVTRNGAGGINTAGTVSGNTVAFNGNFGIENANGTVTGNTVVSNGGTGITALCPATIIGNTVALNGNNSPNLVGAGCVSANNAGN